MDRDAATRVNDNLRTTFLRLADQAPDGATRQFGTVSVAATGFPSQVYNQVFVLESPSRDDVRAALTWVQARDVPFCVTVAEPLVDVVDGTVGELTRSDESERGMVKADLTDLPPHETAVDVAEVTSGDGLDDLLAVFTDVFERPSELAEAVYGALSAADDVRLFVGRVDDHPAASGVLVQSDEVAGVYTIGVREEYRGRGIGTEMSRAVLRAGRDAGCDVGILQTSGGVAAMYRSMGFQTVVTYHYFEPVR